MESKLRMVAMVGLVLLVGLAFWFLRGPSGGTDEAVDEEPTPAASDRGDTRPSSQARSGTTSHGQPQGVAGEVAGSTQRPTAPSTLPQITDLGIAAADAAGDAVPDDERAAEFVHPPVEVLQARVLAATTELPEGRKIEGVTILCLTGGTDCRVTAVAPTPQDLRTFAEAIEGAPAQDGEEAAPTVEINSTQSMSSGMTDFEMGVYYP